MTNLLDRFGAVSDALSSGQFDAVGSNSTTFNYGTGSGDLLSTPFPALPAISSAFAPSATSAGNVVTSMGGATTGGNIPGAGSVAINGTASAPSNAQAGIASTSNAASSVKDYFLRAVIIILGFIFVAVGLNMFRPGLVPNPVNLAKGK